MKSLSEFKTDQDLQFVFTDIDDTLTKSGRLEPNAYQALWDLNRVGYKVVPVTGRPAGWCEMIARFWPVEGVVGENGAFYFRYHDKKMLRKHEMTESERIESRIKLDAIQEKILSEVKGAAVASDQFCRLVDLAIDFCEDVEPLPKTKVDKIVKIFEDAGATAKVSSIHVNGWFGSHSKVSMTLKYLENEFGLNKSDAINQSVFVGDSPNDEPMFQEFPLSFAVANINEFASTLKSTPRYVADGEGGDGFVEIAQKLVALKN